jgi:hypothetical protein
MKKLILAAVAMAALNASAAELSFNNLGLRYQQLDFDCDTNCDGFGIAGTVEFNELLIGELDYQDYNGDVSLAYVGLGLRRGISDTTAVYGTVGAVRLDSDFGDNVTEGYLSLGMRGMITESFEGDASVRYIFEDDSDPSVKLAGTYFFTETVGGQVFLEASDGIFGGGLGLRLNF